jgi:YD repeat-containing protein
VKLLAWCAKALPLVLACTAAVNAPQAFAGACLEAGGTIFCGATYAKPWNNPSLCDEAAPFGVRDAAWCRARGGTGGSNCTGYTPDTEENMVDHAIRFAQELRGNTVSCSLAADSGWGATFSSNFCWNGADVYTEGQLAGTFRRLSIACDGGGGELVSAQKGRDFQCPAGYAVAGHPNNLAPMCARILEDCGEGCKLANPVLPLTGVKVETATDYKHASGLQLTRHYHSYRFSEPYSTLDASHTESRLGVVWRTSFDKRLIPIQPNNRPPKHAISLPSGDVQYFDASGAELYNYSGAAGSLVVVPGAGYYYRGPDSTEFYRTDGRLQSIMQRSGLTLTLAYSDGTSGPNGGFLHDAAGNPTAAALPANRLIRVSDSYGNTLSFGLNALGYIVLMTDPGGDQYRYAYDSIGNLTSVTFPDTHVRSYRYNEPANMVGGASLPHALTGIVDENADLYASFKYKADGRVVSTEHAGQTHLYELAYTADLTSSSVTDPLGTVRTFGIAPVDSYGIARFTGASLPGGAGYGAGIKARSYDTAGNVASQTDHNDIKTCYAYLAGRNLETVRVEGVPAAATCTSVLAAGAALPAGSRKITTEWHARWRLPVRMAEPLRLTTFAYNGDTGATCAPGAAVIAEGGASPVPIAVMCARSVQATTDADGAQGFTATPAGTSRDFSYTYNATGQMLTMDGPRSDVSDVTTYTYDPQGHVATISNAAAHVTSITAYNAHGQPTTIVDANGLTTTLGYERQRLKTRTVGSETTSYDYDFVGQLTKVTLPDTSFVSYTYDEAHRLKRIEDNLGNRIDYTLDAMGNRTLEEVRDPSSVLAQKRSRVYNALNRLFHELGAQNQTTEYAYDDQGNVLTVKDPLNRVTTNQYDALSRLRQVTSPAPISAVTQYAYNGLDALTQVTDPRNLVTGYTVDGLGNLTQQASPDTGTTVNIYDAAGNLLTQTDAKSQVTTYAYDALNRVTLITFHDGSKQAYAYDDQATNGIGRLFSITETNPANQVTSLLVYAYDQHGRVLSEARTVNGVQYVLGYRYDAFGRLDQLTYPSTRTVNYTFDALGRVSGMTTTKPGDQPQTVVSSVTYHPFGGVKGYTLGNAQTYTRGIDLDGRITSYTLGSESFAIGYDQTSRIEFISRFQPATPPNTNTYGYDNLDRLTSATLPTTPYTYAYDSVGNRTSKTSGASTDTYAYSPTSNRIASITPVSGPVKSFVFDPNGSTTADGANTYTYDVRGRMVQATSSIGATSYQVNALGQRIRKTNTLGDTVFHYDAKGKLIAETGPGGALKRELIYLGDIPVGVVQ